jgi:hypothetical protein
MRTAPCAPSCCHDQPEPSRTKKISSSAVSRCAGVDQRSGSTWIRLTPIRRAPVAAARSVHVPARCPSSARSVSASSQCEIIRRILARAFSVVGLTARTTTERRRVDLLWIILIVILVLALLGFFTRGRW